MSNCSGCSNSSCHENFNDQNQCMCGTSVGASVDDLGDTLDEFLQVHEAENVTPLCTPPSDGEYISHIGKESTDVPGVDESESVSVAAQKCLCKCVTFPPRKMSSWSASSDEEEEIGSELPAESCNKCSNMAIAQSTSLPLPSALKGSREKQGMELKKLNVTWAPDVYDPPPTALLPMAKGKSQKQSKIIKNEKNKQKGKASQGSSGKDKKQFQKISGNSNSCFKTLDARDRLVYDDDDVDYDYDYDELLDYDV